MGAAGRLGDDEVDHAKAQEILGGDLLRRGHVLRLGGIAEQDGSTGFGRDHRIDGVFQHQDAVGDSDGDGAARAALADDDGDVGNAQFKALLGGAGDRFGLAALLGADAGISAGRVHKGDQGNVEPVGHFHDADGLAIAFGARHAKIMLEAAFGGIAFFLTENGNRLAVEAAKAGLEGGVLAELAVTCQRRPFGDQLADIVGKVRALRMTGHLGLLPGGEAAVDFHQSLVGAAGEAVHLFVDRHGLIGRGHGLEFGNLACEVGNGFFEIEVRLHRTRLLGACRAPGNGALLLPAKVAGKWRQGNAKSRLLANHLPGGDAFPPECAVFHRAHGCRSGWWKCRRGRAASGRRAGRRRPPGDGWQRHGAARAG